MNRSDEHIAVANELRQCIEAGDVAGVDALYHDDAIVWRNIDNRELVKKQMLRVIDFLANQVSELRYEDVRVQATDDGYVQQHTLQCVGPSGQPVEARACLVVTLRDRKVVRLDEYLDSAAMAPLMS